MRPVILVLIPSRHEAADFLPRLEGATRLKPDGETRVTRGLLRGRPVAVAEIGMGAPVASRRVRSLLAAMPEAEVVWLAGYGGGLDPSLRRGDIVVWERTPGALPESSSLPAHRRPGPVFTASEVVATPEHKARLHRETGRAVVEMEADAVLAETDARGLACAAVRAVSDAADEALPADLLACGYDMRLGRETPLRMMWRLATHPGDIGRLRRFLAALPPVRRALADFLEAAVLARPGAGR